MVDAGEINRIYSKKILVAVLKEDVDPVAYCKENGFDKKIDMAVVDKVIDEAIQNNAQAVADYKNGKAKAIQSVFGACMRELKGIVEPAVIKEMLENKLK